jgi:hypothetical protein
MEGSHGTQGKGVKERDPRPIGEKKWTKNCPQKGHNVLSSYVGRWTVRKNRYFHGSTVVLGEKLN